MSRLKMILALAALPLSVPALAQEGRTRDDVLTEAFRQVGREASRSVVQVYRDSEFVGHGVVIEDGVRSAVVTGNCCEVYGNTDRGAPW